jgi:hypothetical protein
MLLSCAVAPPAGRPAPRPCRAAASFHSCCRVGALPMAKPLSCARSLQPHHILCINIMAWPLSQPPPVPRLSLCGKLPRGAPCAHPHPRAATCREFPTLRVIPYAQRARGQWVRVVVRARRQAVDGRPGVAANDWPCRGAVWYLVLCKNHRWSPVSHFRAYTVEAPRHTRELGGVWLGPLQNARTNGPGKLKSTAPD